LTTADGQATSKNLFLRRIRLIAGGRVTEKLSFFIDTDSPNLGKGLSTGRKVEDYVYLQDIVLTFAVRDEIQIDAGMLLFPLSHNTGQSAATLLAIDYGPYSFVASDATSSRVGRDYGLEARGYVLGKHLEYRLGVFQGYRDVDATAPFRYQGRAVWYPLEAETGFFYTGTTQGVRKILAIGAAFDHQADYAAESVDVFVDRPTRGGDGITLQFGVIRYDGGTTFRQLPAQRDWLLEAGYYSQRTRFGPFVQASGRSFTNEALPDDSKVIAGVAWWASGHRYNLKFGVGRIGKDHLPGRTQVVLQGQLFMY
jgi:hypothetical protein